MPKTENQSAPSAKLWIGGFLVGAALIAAAVAVTFTFFIPQNKCFVRVHVFARGTKSIMTPSHDERILRITEELAQLFNEQTQFFRKGVRETRTEEELLYYEESIERVRELFAELEQLRKAMG